MLFRSCPESRARTRRPGPLAFERWWRRSSVARFDARMWWFAAVGLCGLTSELSCPRRQTAPGRGRENATGPWSGQATAAVAGQLERLVIPLSVQDETIYGMLRVVFNDWRLPWRDRDWWTRGLWGMPRGSQRMRSRPRTRSEERRVGKECNGQCRSRWSPYH